MHPDDRVQQVELAYEIGQQWWNQGLMTEAVKQLLISFSMKLDLIGFLLTMPAKILHQVGFCKMRDDL